MGNIGARIGLPALLAGLFSACAAPPATTSRHGHGDQEMITTGLGVADGWRPAGEWFVSPRLDAPDGASQAGVLLALDAPGPMPDVEARLVRDDGSASEWRPLRATFSEVDHHVAVAELGGTGSAAELRVRSDAVGSISHLRWTAVIPDHVERVAPEADLGARREALRDDLRGIGIVTRREWNARPATCSSAEDRLKNRTAIHYTVTPADNPERQVRAIQRYHQDSRGWCDVGYHFLIGVDGTIYEGRPLELRGAHVGGHNTGNIGIAFIGCFHPSGCRDSWAPKHPPEAMIDAGAQLLHELSRVYGIGLDGNGVRGHRDHSGSSTSCPGDYLDRRLADLRERARTGGSAAVPDPEPTGGDSCSHGLGGEFADTACSADYQCCGGEWLTRGACGVCWCVEESGALGCTDPPRAIVVEEEPPPGESCVHSYGGSYAHTACSPGYQCCDGAWTVRGGSGSCGACLCEEESGTLGCGGGTPAPSTPSGSDPYAGLSLGGSEIPRSGLSNPTLRSTLGISVEPYGMVTTVGGQRWVQGRVSWFGGPTDTGVSSTETGAITGERLRSLNDPMSPSASTLASRPEDYYFVAMRWSYSPNSTGFWRDARILVRHPSTGVAYVARPVDWGPHTSTRRIIDLSPQLIDDLGLSTDQDALVAFAAPGTPLGLVD